MEPICCGFGQDDLAYVSADYLYEVIVTLIKKYKVKTFYDGGMNSFDTRFFLTVTQAKKIYKDIQLVLIVPLITPRFGQVNSYLNRHWEAYDDFICRKAKKGYSFRDAVRERNRWMVRQSEFVLSGVRSICSPAYANILYARIKGKTVIDVAKQDL